MTEEKKPMKKNQNIIIAVIVAVVILGSVAIFASNAMKPSADKNQGSAMSKVSSPNYVDYTADIAQKASENDVVLFFKAPWCPTCNATDKDINANLSTIPKNLIIVKTDYDSQTALKRKYGVNIQHTFVKIDKDGNELKKANGLNTLKEIVDFAKSDSSSMMMKNDSMEKQTDVMTKSNDAMVKPPIDTMTKPTEQNSEKKNLNTTVNLPVEEKAITKAGVYTNYSSDLLAQADSGNVILFFNASWCPSCQSTVKDINANLSKIPSNLTILSVDYDKETALRQKYGITAQHSYVKVDKDGNEIKKSPYGQLKTLENIINFAK